ncbi:hypothetical protein JXM67_03900 [candidate division WOR-3 bacterium]|nr:hypothetical protein [candidate division WOR-3 bacterium]
MFKKSLIIITLVTVGATAVVAANWSGTYTGYDSGEWKATITAFQDPVLFQGVWMSKEGQTGTLYAEGDIYNGNYVFKEGDILSDDGEIIGHWSGTFSIYNDTHETGPWWTEEGEGTWEGSQ